MPWAIFDRPFDHDLRPERAVCISVQPSKTPQRFPTPLVEAAIAAGAARPCDHPVTDSSAVVDETMKPKGAAAAKPTKRRRTGTKET